MGLGCGVFFLTFWWTKPKGKSNEKGDKTLSSAVHNLYDQLGGKILTRRIKEMEKSLFNIAEEKNLSNSHVNFSAKLLTS